MEINKFTKKQKWIYATSFLAVFSMFLPWTVWGMRSDSGWEANYFIALPFWILPVLSAYQQADRRIVNSISIFIGGIALVRFFGGDEASISIAGNTYSSSVGAGAYVYAIAWVTAMFATLIVDNNSKASSKPPEISSESIDSEYFIKAKEIFEEGQIDDALWSKCLILSDGDEEKAKYEYIRQDAKRLYTLDTTISNSIDKKEANRAETKRLKVAAHIFNIVMLAVGLKILHSFLFGPIEEANGLAGGIGLVMCIASYFVYNSIKKIS